MFAVSGILLTVGFHFANTQVTARLTEQHIYFPGPSDPQLKEPAIGPYLTKYATPTQTVNGQTVGQQLTSGNQAEAYANHYIAVHLQGIAGGLTYSEVSGQWLACLNTQGLCSADKTATLANERQTLFMGETLRGLLLNAYAFWTFGQIALWAAIGAFIAAGLLAVFAVFGFIHLRRVPDTAEIGVHHAATAEKVA